MTPIRPRATARTRVRAVAVIASLPLVAALAACSSPTASTSPTSSATPSASAGTTGIGTTSTSAAGTSAGAGTPSPSASEVMPTYSATPAPSTAGDLTQKSFVVPSGWTPVVADISEQGLTPNGVPVHARQGAEVSLTMLQPCGMPPTTAPANPTHVLEMNLKKGSDLGVGELIEFTTAAQAKAWFDTLRTQLVACQKTTPGLITRIESTSSVWRGRRNLGSDGVYSEVDVLRGRRIVNYALQDPKQTVDTVALVKKVLAQA